MEIGKQAQIAGKKILGGQKNRSKNDGPREKTTTGGYRRTKATQGDRARRRAIKDDAKQLKKIKKIKPEDGWG